MSATDMGSGAERLQVHGPAIESARDLFRVKQCGRLAHQAEDAEMDKDADVARAVPGSRSAAQQRRSE